VLTPALASTTTERVSVSSAGAEAGNDCVDGAISLDGRYVAFVSCATNLVAGDTNEMPDVFVRDRLAGTTERVSVSTGGGQANGCSDLPAISADGRYVSFESYATDLVASDTNGKADVFVHDRLTGATERISLSSVGGQGDDDSSYSALSSNGRYVAFDSYATNLVAGDTNACRDVFVHDRDTDATERVSLPSGGGEANNGCAWPSISSNGRYVGFTSCATNLVAGDTNVAPDVFVRDRTLSTTERVSVSSGGAEGDSCSMIGRPALSGDGRYVAFESPATNLVAGDTNAVHDIFVRDRVSDTTERVSLSSGGAEANSASVYASISSNGRFVAFSSAASNLVTGDTNAADDAFLRDRKANTTQRISVSSTGAEANSYSYALGIDKDGGFVAFLSSADNLVSGDTNEAEDIFVRGPLAYPIPEVLLEVHPNERAPGQVASQFLGGAPWTQPTTSAHASYVWKKYVFAGSDTLWIQICAQNMAGWQQTGHSDDDNTWMTINATMLPDYDGIQQGNPWGWQWRGSKEQGQRWALRFLWAGGLPGTQTHNLWVGADESPLLWWVKVTDLEPQLVYPPE
jgi:hypothetical protein